MAIIATTIVLALALRTACRAPLEFGPDPTKAVGPPEPEVAAAPTIEAESRPTSRVAVFRPAVESREVETSTDTAAVAEAPALPVLIQVVDRVTGAALSGVAVARVADPLAFADAEAKMAAETFTDDQGMAAVENGAPYLIAKDGWIPICERAIVPAGAEHRTIRLSPVRRRAVRLVCDGAPVADCEILLSENRHMADVLADPSPRWADVGRWQRRKTDSDGVAEFVVAAGDTGIVTLPGNDYLLADDASGRPTFPKDSTEPAEVRLVRIWVGGVQVVGAPRGWSYRTTMVLSPGLVDYEDARKKSGPFEARYGHIHALKALLKVDSEARLAGEQGLFVPVLVVGNAPKPSAELRFSSELVAVASCQVALAPPSVWSWDRAAQLRVNTDRITALQRTRIRFAGHDVGADDEVPAVGIDIRGKSAAGKRVLLSDLVRLQGAPLEYRLPPGSYSVLPSPDALRKWPTAMCFERTEFEVAEGAEGEVVVLLDRPLSLVKLTVVDDDGRPIRGHTIFTKGDGARTTSHSEMLLAFDDEVADLKVLTGDIYGLEDVELKQVALKRGQTTPIRVQLRRKEVR